MGILTDCRPFTVQGESFPFLVVVGPAMVRVKLATADEASFAPRIFFLDWYQPKPEIRLRDHVLYDSAQRQIAAVCC